MSISIKDIPELTVIDPRIEYPKWTRNKKKKRITLEEYYKYEVYQATEFIYGRLTQNG